MRFQETLRRLAMIEKGFVEDEAGLGPGPVSASALAPKTAALLQVGACVAIGSPAVCLEWSTGGALAAGANEDEIADVLPVGERRRAQRLAPPPDHRLLIADEPAATVAATVALGIMLLCLAWAGRWVLDRRRLAAWEAAWAAVGPQWTRRFRSRG